ncbi:MAG: glycosyltransferase family 2 protein [Flavobacterium sp.]|nr:MAG: glycosyltransferase family 2 protein [Flavobacterium sp.]
MNKSVFVVIVTYNGAVWLDRNLSSLRQSDYPVTTIAVDNNSADASIEILEKYSEADVIKSGENLGFGKANNIGITKALEQGADYVFLLNQDAWVFPNTISSLVGKMENNQNFGIVSPMHYVADELTLDENFKTYYSRRTGLDGNLAIVPFVNAAAWMVSRQCFEKVGMFEPYFSHYGEDRNYCERVTYHKLKIGIDEDSRIVHDRTIVRNFAKDTIQSKYKILTTLLNINKPLAGSYIVALKEVIGLPKYFSKAYGTKKSTKLFFSLAGYYAQMLAAVGTVTRIRENSKRNG